MLVTAACLLAGCLEREGVVEVRRPGGMPRAAFDFRLVLPDAIPGSLAVTQAGGTVMALAADAILTQADVTRVDVGPSPINEPYYEIHLHIRPEAAERLREVTADNLGRQLAIVMDGKVLMAPHLQGPVGSPAVITGSYSRDDAVRIAERLAP